jgi:thioesterase domain-containing protein
MVQLQPGAGKPPFVFIDGDFWGDGFYVRQLAAELGPDYPFYDLHAHGRYTDTVPSIEEMAADYRRLLTAAGLRGPFRLGGHCNGAIIAWELARQLLAAGERVELVVMIEPMTLNARPSMRALARALRGAAALGGARVGSEAMGFLWRVVHFAERRWFGLSSGSGDDIGMLAERVTRRDPLAVAKFAAYRRTMASYMPPRLDIEVLCMIAQSHAGSRVFSAEPWRRLTPRLEPTLVPGEHLTCITTHVDTLAGRLRQRLKALDVTPAVPGGIQSTTISSRR